MESVRNCRIKCQAKETRESEESDKICKMKCLAKEIRASGESRNQAGSVDLHYDSYISYMY